MNKNSSQHMNMKIRIYALGLFVLMVSAGISWSLVIRVLSTSGRALLPRHFFLSQGY